MLIRNAANILLTRIALMPIGMAAGVVTARFLGPSDRGIYALLVLLSATAAALLNVGLDTATVHFHNKEKTDLSRLFANASAYALLAGTGACLVIWFSRDYVTATFEGVQPIYLVFTLPLIPLRLLNTALSAAIRAKHDFTLYNKRHAAEVILGTLGVMLVFFVLNGTLIEVLIADLLVLTLVCAWMLIDVRKHLTLPLRPDFALMRRMLGFGVKTYAAIAIKHVHTRSDLYIVALYLSTAEVAFYSIGARLAERLLLIPAAFNAVLFPRLSSLEDAAAAKMSARACRNLLALTTLCTLLIVISARPLIRILYGEAYLPAVAPLNVIILGVGCVAAIQLLAIYLRSINRLEYLIYILAVSSGLNILLNIWLIPRYGIVGAALSSLITYSLQAGCTLVFFVKFSGLPVKEVIVINRQDLWYMTEAARRLWSAPSRPARATARADSVQRVR